MNLNDYNTGSFVYDENNNICRLCSTHTEEYMVYSDESRDETAVQYSNRENIYNSTNINPISLTDAWHHQFGGMKRLSGKTQYTLPKNTTLGGTIAFCDGYVMLRQQKSNSEFEIISLWNKDITGRDMYVHEFQDIWFALTRERLVIKNK